MPWALISLVVLALGTGSTPEKPGVPPAASKTAASAPASIEAVSLTYDEQAEQQLLELTNRARMQAGVAPLTIDPGITLAARAHADSMAHARQLSHQLQGEPSLTSRLAAKTDLHMDRAGENVAFDSSVTDAYQRLMMSPPHRENMLDPAYNVAGVGVIQAGGRMYIVQDFGRSLPVYSTEQTEGKIQEALRQARRQNGLPELEISDVPAVREAACSMALEDRLATSQMHQLSQRYTVVNYSNLHPEILPVATLRLINDRRITGVAIGACYARTMTYPTGAYWVGIAVY